MSKVSSRPVRWWFYPLLLAVTCLLCLAVAETAVRVVWSLEHPVVPDPSTFDAEVGMVHIPGHYRLPFVRCLAAQPECDKVEINFTVNAQGFRGAGFRQPAGQPLVMVLGDSQVEGKQVNDNQLATYHLEQALRQTFPDAEVRNLGMTSSGFVHYYQRWRKFVLAAKPQVLVVVAFGTNDFRNCSTELETFATMRPHYGVAADGTSTVYFERRQPPPLWRRRLASCYDWLEVKRFLEWLRTVRSADEKATQTAGVTIFPDLRIYEEPPTPAYAAASELGREYLQRLIKEARAAGTKVLVAALPMADEAIDANWAKLEAAYAQTGRPRLSRKRPENIIKETALANGAGFISVAEACAKLPPEQLPGLWHVRNDGHLTVAGQKFLAETLTPRIVEMLQKQ